MAFRQTALPCQRIDEADALRHNAFRHKTFCGFRRVDAEAMLPTIRAFEVISGETDLPVLERQFQFHDEFDLPFAKQRADFVVLDDRVNRLLVQRRPKLTSRNDFIHILLQDGQLLFVQIAQCRANANLIK